MPVPKASVLGRVDFRQDKFACLMITPRVRFSQHECAINTVTVKVRGTMNEFDVSKIN